MLLWTTNTDTIYLSTQNSELRSGEKEKKNRNRSKIKRFRKRQEIWEPMLQNKVNIKKNKLVLNLTTCEQHFFGSSVSLARALSQDNILREGRLNQ